MIADERRTACISQGTGQCAAICLSHMSIHKLGTCPEIERVWTPEAVARERQRRPDGPLRHLALDAAKTHDFPPASPVTGGRR